MYNVSSNYASMEQDKKVHIKFTNNTGKLIDSTTLVTNNWGTVNGYFIAPKDINGDYGISINNNYCWFNVDEYKPATLDIIITPTNKDYKYGDNI